MKHFRLASIAIAALLLIPAAPAEAALTDGLRAFYKLDESSGTAADSSGNGYTLTNNNSAAYTTGLIGNAITFGTGNTSKSLSTTNAVGIDGGHFSFSLFVKLNDSGQSGNFIWNGSDGNDVRSRIAYQGGPSLLFQRTKNAIADQQATYNTTLSTGSFTHIGMTFDGSTIRGYVNGSQVASASASGSGTGSTSTGTHVGMNQNSEYADATIDMVGLWNRALTADEMSALYNGGAGLQITAGTSDYRSEVIFFE